jgi:hypothetical protein
LFRDQLREREAEAGASKAVLAFPSWSLGTRRIELVVGKKREADAGALRRLCVPVEGVRHHLM